MNILKVESIYELTNEDVPRFSFTSVLYTDGENMFITRIPRRLLKRERESLDVSALNGDLVNKTHVYPPFIRTEFSRFTGTMSETDVYLKKPDLMMYRCDGSKENTNMWKILHQEATICEVLKRFPHPHIAKYLGCYVEHGLLVGLCFQRYGENLRQRIDRCTHDIDKALCMEAVRIGVQHLHALGLCHNDIGPDNIMFDAKNTPVIVDFDSCQRKGLPLGPKGGTLGFVKTDTTVSDFENDLYALQKLEEYLNEHV